ncbi:MAG: hypothetical protein OYG31_03310 [Candidatus Kaiserbacteria bacterium]|nr:hypothetical protein [Candidatus Kaiserbacteria bacterium]
MNTHTATVHQQFEPIFQYVDGDDGDIVDSVVVDRFAGEPDSIKQLKLLSEMTVADMLTCIERFASPKGLHHFLNRLTLYQENLLEKGVNPRDIKVGIVRDALFSMMADTPERAIYDDAHDIVCESCGEENALPQLRGRYSHVSDGGVGFMYPALQGLYLEASDQSEREGDEFVSDPVDIASEWLAEAAHYLAPGEQFRNMRALQEALSWAQIQDSVLRERLRKMHHQGESLKNLRRFTASPDQENLLHKAVVLHDSLSDTYSPIDWINHAPFPSITRAHQSLQDGSMLDDIVSGEVVYIILGEERGEDDVAAVQSLFGKAKHGLSSVRRDLENMVKVATILSEQSCPYSFGDVSQIASERFDGLSHALHQYDLEAVKEYLRSGVSLRDAMRGADSSVSLLSDDAVANVS